MASLENTITLDTGEVRLNVVDTHNKHLGDLVFNPTDLVWAEQYTQFVYELQTRERSYAKSLLALSANVDKRRKKIEKLTDSETPEQDAVNDLTDLNKADTDKAFSLLNTELDFVKGQIDKLFGDKTYSTLFGTAKSLEGLRSFFIQTMNYFSQEREGSVEQYLPKKTSKKRKRSRK